MDLIVGYGEVGRALMDVLKERYAIEVHDPPKGLNAPVQEYGWMHICVSYTTQFVEVVVSYIEMFKPAHVVIHSTVPVGTCLRIEENMMSLSVIYSPVRGIHPHLTRYLREFPKWFYTGDNAESVAFQGYMAQVGIQTRQARGYGQLELMKLWETTEYGYRIVMWQEIERELKSLYPGWGSHPEDYEVALSDMKAWLFEKRKVYDGDRGLVPILFGGVIGGHCVKENWELQKPMMTPEFYTWLVTSQRLRAKRP